MNRYSRQQMLHEIGSAGQARLGAARVLVVGVGGLGSTLLPLLAGAGIGQICLVDPDRVELGNLHRQTMFRMEDIGQHKAQVAAKALLGLNPDCAVTPIVRWLDPQLAAELVDAVDVVVDAADNFAVTYALSDLCLQAAKPFVSASVLGRAGYVAGFCGSAPSCRAVFPDLPPRAQDCSTSGVMGPAVAVMGALQAQMVLSVVLGHDPSPLGQMIRVDLASWRMSAFRFDGAPECSGPAIVAASQLRPDDLVVDLRSEVEAPTPAHETAQRLPFETLHPTPGQRVVFACATGLRAWRAARALTAKCGNPAAVLLAPR